MGVFRIAAKSHASPDHATPSLSHARRDDVMRNLRWIRVTPIAVWTPLLLAMHACHAIEKPNIIVIYTDDHGYADLSCQQILPDVKTPHIDALAQSGVRMTDGYCTAPQCVPSRAGLITGRYQNRFGLESNPQGKDAEVMQQFADVDSLPEKLQQAGYATGMAGKWHLGAPQQIGTHGFDQFFHKNSNSAGYWNMALDGGDIPPGEQRGGGYHLNLISEFACAFIRRHSDRPFFFYLAFRAPHVPLDPPQNYLNQFPGEMPERRRKALAMLAAVDDGVGSVVETLRSLELEEQTLIFFVSDNGAPLKIHKLDAPGGGPGWDGSLNDPLNGEKGMLTEGGIRVPFVAAWKGTIPPSQVYSQPVITLDLAATALAAAGVETATDLDGVNLLPYLTDTDTQPPQRSLYWRWLNQSAIRNGPWKYIELDQRRYLFNVEKDKEELNNLFDRHTDVADRLQKDLQNWSQQMSPPGIGALATEGRSQTDQRFYDWYIEGIRDDRPSEPTTDATRNRSPRPKVTQQELFRRRDTDKDGNVTLEEFLNGRTGDAEKTLRRRFRQFDRNQNGRWERSEIDTRP